MRPQKHPHPWTKVTSRHRASTPSTLCVDRRLHFSSASTKTPPSVDKCHQRAPCVHARGPLCVQAIAFLFCVHKNTPIRGQKSPPGTVHPHQAPSVWTGGCISLPRPQKHPHLWTKVTSRHRTSTLGTSCVDKSHLLAPCVHARHPLRGGCISLPRPQKHPHPWTKVTSVSFPDLG